MHIRKNVLIPSYNLLEPTVKWRKTQTSERNMGRLTKIATHKQTAKSTLITPRKAWNPGLPAFFIRRKSQSILTDGFRGHLTKVAIEFLASTFVVNQDEQLVRAQRLDKPREKLPFPRPAWHVSGVNYFFSLTTIISPYQRQLLLDC